MSRKLRGVAVSVQLVDFPEIEPHSDVYGMRYNLPKRTNYFDAEAAAKQRRKPSAVGAAARPGRMKQTRTMGA
jgi:hypothetical protein